MIDAETRAAVLRRDGYQCRFGLPPDWHSGGLDLQVAHVLFGDRKGKHTPKDIKDWVDEPWNLAAICRVCNVDRRADKTYEARMRHVERMMRLDETGFLKWYKRKPAKLQDAEVRLIVARAVADSYNRVSNKQIGGVLK